MASIALLLVTAKAICFKETFFFAFLVDAFFAALLVVFLADFLADFFTAFLAVFFAGFRFGAVFFFVGRPRLTVAFLAGRPRRLAATFLGLRPRRLAGAEPVPPRAASISANFFSESATVACALASVFDNAAFSDCKAARAR